MRIEIISVPVPGIFGTLIFANETLIKTIKTNHEKSHNFMKAEIYKDKGHELMGAAFDVYNDRGYGLAEEEARRGTQGGDRICA